ncbi:hypothetical protein SSBG_00946 [Streptomyces sp. SPB074]|nr:hypothetical protein SSBG_00946 [Streptomyces sp. SPB074]
MRRPYGRRSASDDHTPTRLPGTPLRLSVRRAYRATLLTGEGVGA